MQTLDPSLIPLMTPQERAFYDDYLARKAIEADEPEAWVRAIFPRYVPGPMGEHHMQLWEWVWSFEFGRRVPVFVGIWPRGHAKSTSAEMAVVAVGARLKRKYCLYVSAIQDQADKHVGSIASMLESDRVARYYPEVAKPLKGKYGNSKGWRRERVRCANGFTIDALGLQEAVRGLKVDEARPDFIILDDIDRLSESPAVIEKKVATLTSAILPAGSQDVAVLAVQNLINDRGIFARLAPRHEGQVEYPVPPADFMMNRITSGPIPAVEDLAFHLEGGRAVIESGRPTWPGMDLESCQAQIDLYGFTSFLTECQHELRPVKGGIFDEVDFPSLRVANIPQLKTVSVWLDPAVTATDQSDSQGIVVGGLGIDNLFYVLYSFEGIMPPLAAMKKAILNGVTWGAQRLGVETDQGRDTWEIVYRQALMELSDELEGKRIPIFQQKQAGSGHGGKMIRAQLMRVDFERNRFRFLDGPCIPLERALTRFPKVKPFDLADACYWLWQDLTGGLRPMRTRSSARDQIREAPLPGR